MMTSQSVPLHFLFPLVKRPEVVIHIYQKYDGEWLAHFVTVDPNAFFTISCASLTMVCR